VIVTLRGSARRFSIRYRKREKKSFHTSGGTAKDFAPSQEDPYLAPCQDLKLITCLVPEIFILSPVKI
jgi:hypothetical protein